MAVKHRKLSESLIVYDDIDYSFEITEDWNEIKISEVWNEIKRSEDWNEIKKSEDWNEIKGNPQVSVSIDIFRMGIYFSERKWSDTILL